MKSCERKHLHMRIFHKTKDQNGKEIKTNIDLISFHPQ